MAIIAIAVIAGIAATMAIVDIAAMDIAMVVSTMTAVMMALKSLAHSLVA